MANMSTAIHTFASEITRRRVVRTGLAAFVAATGGLAFAAAPEPSAAAGAAYPAEVAGIAIPRTKLANAAVRFVRGGLGSLLFNHSMRVFVFGSIIGRHLRISYDDEMLLIASLFHDVGLVEEFATPEAPFELDGADAARRFLTDHGVDPERSESVWKTIAFHNSDLLDRFPAPIGLVSEGATVDFVGSRAEIITAEIRDEVVDVFPRLNFKKGIQEILTTFCQRKPMAQSGGWGDVYCQSHTKGIAYPKLSDLIERSPFSE